MLWDFFWFWFFEGFFSFSFLQLSPFFVGVNSPAYMVKTGGNTLSYNRNTNDCSVSKSIVQSRSNSVL